MIVCKRNSVYEGPQAYESRVEDGACIIGLEQLAKENERCRRSLGHLQCGFDVVDGDGRGAFASPSDWLVGREREVRGER